MSRQPCLRPGPDFPVSFSRVLSLNPEKYLKERFGGNRIQMLLSTLSIVLYIFINISGDLYAGSVYIKIALGWNTYVSIIGARFKIKIYPAFNSYDNRKSVIGNYRIV